MKAKTNPSCRCLVPGQQCRRGHFSRGHHFFLSPLNAPAGEHGEGRQSQQEHMGSSALLQLQPPTTGHRGENLGTLQKELPSPLTSKGPCSAGFPCWPLHPAPDPPGFARPPVPLQQILSCAMATLGDVHTPLRATMQSIPRVFRLPLLSPPKSLKHF